MHCLTTHPTVATLREEPASEEPVITGAQCLDSLAKHLSTAIYTTAAGQTPPLQTINQKTCVRLMTNSSQFHIVTKKKKLSLINVKHLRLFRLVKTKPR